jgi:hypothetical protein
MKAKHLPRYRFVDAKFPSPYYYPVWEAHIPPPSEIKTIPLDIKISNLDYEREVLDRLPDYQSNIARKISLDRKIELSEAKQNVSATIDKLRKQQVIEYANYLTVRNQLVNIYWRKNDPKQLLQYMLEDVKSILREASLEINGEMSVRSKNTNSYEQLTLDFCKIIMYANPSLREVQQQALKTTTILLMPNEQERLKFKDSELFPSVILLPELLPTIQKLKLSMQN